MAKYWSSRNLKVCAWQIAEAKWPIPYTLFDKKNFVNP